MMFEDKKKVSDQMKSIIFTIQEKQFSTAEAFNGKDGNDSTARSNGKTTAQSSAIPQVDNEKKVEEVEKKTDDVEDIADAMADFAGMLGDDDEDDEDIKKQEQLKI